MSAPKKPKVLSSKRILLPILFSIAVITFMFYYSFEIEALQQVKWDSRALFWISAALLLMVVRISLYAYRLKLASGNQFTWLQGYQVAILWDFASAVTPSTVGGAAVSVFIMNQERVSLGKGTAIVMLVSFLDQLFYVISVPILMLLVGYGQLFPDPDCLESSNLLGVKELGSNLLYVFILGYTFLFSLVVFLGWGLFLNPHKIKKMFLGFFSWKLFRRWKSSAEKTGDDIITASAYYKSQPRSFWVKIITATVVAWSARFLICCCIILAFTGTGDQLVVYTRQFVLWIITLLPTTPGASGVAEYSFVGLLCEFIPRGLELPISQAWRLLTYYTWILIGALMLPSWFNKVGKYKNNSTTDSAL